MDKQLLLNKLDILLQEDLSSDEEIAVKLVKQVWEINPNESIERIALAIYKNNMGYFLDFMVRDRSSEDDAVDSEEWELVRGICEARYAIEDRLSDRLQEIWDSVQS